MEELDRYTKEQWRAKYQLAEKRAQEAAKLAGERMNELRKWQDTAERICIELGIEWPENDTFYYVVIQAFRKLKAAGPYILSEVEGTRRQKGANRNDE